jgi:hypothetical protein
LHQTARQYSQTPSRLLAIEDEPLLAWWVDEAVGIYGQWIEARLDEREPVKEQGQIVGYKPRWRLGQLLGTERPRKASRQALIAMFGG